MTMCLDYDLRIEKPAPFSDDEVWSLWQKGIKLGTTTWGYVKQFRDYYGILDAHEVVETWKFENQIK